MARRLVPAVVATCLVAGCSAPTAERRTATPEATAVPSDPIVGQEPVSLSDAEPRWLPGLRAVDLAEAVDAPSVAADPPGRVLLATMVSSFHEGPAALAPGEPVVLAADGAWRRVLAEEHDVDGAWGVETPFDVSDDGRVLALVEEGTDRLVVIDLADGSSRDLTLPTRDAVGLELGRTGAAVTFADRRAGLDDGWRRIDVATGKVVPAEVPWDVAAQAYTDDGSAGLRIGDARLVGTPRQLTWLGPAGGDPDRVVAAVGRTGRVYRWVPATGSLELVARVSGAALSLSVAGEVLDDLLAS